MGLFSFLRRRKPEDIEDIRSHILGEPPARLTEPPMENEPAPVDEPYPSQYPAPEPGYGRFGAPPAPQLGSDFEAMSEFAPQQRGVPEARGGYDISQRLDIIEAQLGAIRSQTETINERLKNLEMKLTRRY